MEINFFDNKVEKNDSFEDRAKDIFDSMWYETSNRDGWFVIDIWDLLKLELHSIEIWWVDKFFLKELSSNSDFKLSDGLSENLLKILINDEKWIEKAMQKIEREVFKEVVNRKYKKVEIRDDSISIEWENTLLLRDTYYVQETSLWSTSVISYRKFIQKNT